MARNEPLYRNILDSLRPASLSALMDVADGMWMAVFEWNWITSALRNRGLITEYLLDDTTPIRLTELGSEFVRWYRGRDVDLPVQEQLL